MPKCQAAFRRLFFRQPESAQSRLADRKPKWLPALAAGGFFRLPQGGLFVFQAAVPALESSLKALIDDYIRLNYAAAGSPAAAVAQAWFRRARQLSKKYRLADG